MSNTPDPNPLPPGAFRWTAQGVDGDDPTSYVVGQAVPDDTGDDFESQMMFIGEQWAQAHWFERGKPDQMHVHVKRTEPPTKTGAWFSVVVRARYTVDLHAVSTHIRKG